MAFLQAHGQAPAHLLGRRASDAQWASLGVRGGGGQAGPSAPQSRPPGLKGGGSPAIFN